MAKGKTPKETFDQQFERAEKAGIRASGSEQKAVSACYVARSRRMKIDLASGITLLFPSDLVQGLAGVPPSALEEVEILAGGTILHWETLDVDLGVDNLMKGIFGTHAWMKQLFSDMGRKGGSSRSRSKIQASRANGRLGGRPRKSGVG